MNKRIMAVCDTEESYTDRLAEYLGKKQNFPFEEIELILISERAYHERVKELQDFHIILLNESGKVEHPEYVNVDKYQSAEGIVREMMCYCTEQAAEFELPGMLGTGTKLIGIYSPVKRSLQTTFALTMGQLLAQRESVLYLNFESYSGFQEIMGRQYESDLTDLLYFAKHTRGKLLYRVESIVETVGGLHYVPPVFSVADLNMVSGEEWREFLLQLCEKCNYDYIILDLSDNIRGLFEVLRMCEVVYTMVSTERTAQAKVKQYEQLLARADYTDVLSKTKKCDLPWFTQIGENVELFAFGQLADYIRNLLREDSYGRL